MDKDNVMQIPSWLSQQKLSWYKVRHAVHPDLFHHKAMMTKPTSLFGTVPLVIQKLLSPFRRQEFSLLKTLQTT